MKKVALVTGSSRGIGRAVAAELARDGYAVCINYYERKDKADELVALLRAEGREAIAVQADVSKRSEVNAMVAQCERELGKITLLVNNAGVAGQALADAHLLLGQRQLIHKVERVDDGFFAVVADTKSADRDRERFAAEPLAAAGGAGTLAHAGL